MFCIVKHIQQMNTANSGEQIQKVQPNFQMGPEDLAHLSIQRIP